MRDDNQRRKKIATGQQEEFAGAEDRELTKEQDRGGEISDEYDRLDGRNETINPHQLVGREGGDSSKTDS